MRSPWNEPPRGRAGPTRRRPQGGTAGDARSCKLPNSSPAPSPHPPVSGYKQELPVRANKRTASTSPQHQRAACDAQTGAALHLPDAQALWEQDAVGEAASGPRPQKAAPKSTVAGQDKAERQDRPKETQQRPGSPKGSRGKWWRARTSNPNQTKGASASVLAHRRIPRFNKGEQVPQTHACLGTPPQPPMARPATQTGPAHRVTNRGPPFNREHMGILIAA